MTYSRQSNLRAIVEASFLVSMALFGALVGYWTLDRDLPYLYHTVGAEIIPNPATEGGRVTVKWPVTVNRLCPGVVHRSLRNAISNAPLAQYDPSPSSLTVRYGDREIAKTFELPASLPPIVKYDATICFRCNPLQAIFPLCTSTPTLVFTVAKPAR